MSGQPRPLAAQLKQLRRSDNMHLRKRESARGERQVRVFRGRPANFVNTNAAQTSSRD